MTGQMEQHRSSGPFNFETDKVGNKFLRHIRPKAEEILVDKRKWLTPKTTLLPTAKTPPATFRTLNLVSTLKARKFSLIMALASTKQRHVSLLSCFFFGIANLF